MNLLQPVIKRDIYALFKDGFGFPGIWGEEITVIYPYYGRLEEVEFLNRLYPLHDLPSIDTKFTNAEDEIFQHTVRNDDYPLGWVFRDSRFELDKGSDEIFLKFLCEIFHPEVRDEKSEWNYFLDRINSLLKESGYIIYPAGKIPNTNREVYSWKAYVPEEKQRFVPFSERYAKAIRDKKIKFTLPRKVREQIYNILEKYDENLGFTNETGFNYTRLISELVFDDIREFYTPKAYDETKSYVETDNMRIFINHSSPKCVFDAIELFGRHTDSKEFGPLINQVFQLSEIPYSIKEGEISQSIELPFVESAVSREPGLQELLQESAKYYRDGNKKIAVEKLWDAFERLKTYYSPALKKPKSIEKVIEEMSMGIDMYRQMFTQEFETLTSIGNGFRIRHHETTKTDIPSDNYYEYFFQRCYVLIKTALAYVEH